MTAFVYHADDVVCDTLGCGCAGTPWRQEVSHNLARFEQLLDQATPLQARQIEIWYKPVLKRAKHRSKS
jgi:hypothetical protein